MSERKMVLCYNGADPDESFVTMMTEEEMEQANNEWGRFSKELWEAARANEVALPAVCYYC